jgi:hypothetical protein
MLGVRRDHLVFGSDKVPAWLCSPCRLGDRTTERLDTPRDLRVGHKRSHIRTHVRGEEGREFGFIKEQESILGRQDRRGRRSLRCILNKRPRRLAPPGFQPCVPRQSERGVAINRRGPRPLHPRVSFMLLQVNLRFEDTGRHSCSFRMHVVIS